MKNYIPRRDIEMDEWQADFTAIVAEKSEAWGIGAEAMASLEKKRARWNRAFAATSNAHNRTKADVTEKNEARREYEKELRKFVKRHLAFNPAVADADRERMGLTVPSRHRTPPPVPATVPEVRVDFSTSMRHTLHFRDAHARRSAKPEGVYGCEIWSKTGGEAPTTETELTFAGLDTRSPRTIEYGFEHRGTTVHYRLRWVNTRGERGPWSAPVSAIIA